MAALAMLCASVATGTALASDDEPSDVTGTMQAQTTQIAGDNGGGSNDTILDGGQTDVESHDGEDSEGDTAEADGNVDDSSDGNGVGEEDADKQTAVDEDVAADDGDADGGSSDFAASNVGIGASARALGDHTVSGVSPRGTTIDLFDYDGSGSGENGTINPGHVLRFASGSPSDYSVVNKISVNQWTGNSEHGGLKPAPRSGIVQDKLGVDGYPVLSEAIDGESLDYLFNDENVSGKTSYMGVNGLLQVDGEGYYYYNSQENFAQFNPDSDSFTLYDTWGVSPVGNSPDGQFFPFNTGDLVFTEDADGLKQNGLKSGDNKLNHYFGLTMSTRFVQQYGGYTAEEGDSSRQPVTYNFSGDDDVWVYIDGVLVGDLGGIHDQVSLQIDFSTGKVVVYTDGRDSNNQSNNVFDADTAIDGTDPKVTAKDVQGYMKSGTDVYWQQTTLKDLFASAGVDVDGWDSNTLPDNTYHTLDFFYLERGASDSNMALRYNLVNIPETGIVKIDQNGNEMAGVTFTLQQADASYNLVSGGTTVEGTTDDDGELILTHTNVGGATGTPYSLDDLGNISRYWVLTENDTPDGYRGVQPVHLYFAYGQTDNENLGTGPLLVGNQWDTGAYSAPHVTVQADATVHGTKGKSYDLDDGGTLFAVVMKHVDSNSDGKLDSDDAWRPVSGDAFEGWTVHDSGNAQQDIIAAAQANPYIFTPGTNGSYETTIEDLPGDIRTYRHMIQEYQDKTYDEATAMAEYSVAYFYTTGDLSAPAGSDNAVTSDNTAQINSEGGTDSQAFDRIFSVTLNVPNIKNELKLKKTDTTGNPIRNVKFELYNADDVTDGVPNADAQPVSTLTTGEDGTLQVYSDIESQILAKGNYVLVEIAPDGYVDQKTAIPVVVDDSGVYADAGTEDDNVTVETGLGTLVYSMKGFAAGDQVDATLHDVQAQPQTSTDNLGDAQWVDAGDVLHLQYDDDRDGTLDYVATKGGGGDSITAATFTAVSGWLRLNVTQCANADHQTEASSSASKQDLGDQSLNALFTGDVTINVTNVRPVKVSFPIQKVLEGRSWADDDEFSFTVTADGNNPANGATLPSNKQGVLGTTTNPVVITDETSFTDSDGESVEHAVKYGDIAIGVVGEYRFTVAEVRGNAPGMSYSQDVYTVTVNVESLTGTPNVTIIRNDDKKPLDSVVAVFTNTFTGVSSLPLTGGDTTARNLLLAGGGVLLLAGAAWLLARRRRG